MMVYDYNTSFSVNVSMNLPLIFVLFLFFQMMRIVTCREIGLWIMEKDIKLLTFFEWELIQL